MEKEQILSELTTRLGQTSLSSQTLMKYIELNPVAEGVEPIIARRHLFFKECKGSTTMMSQPKLRVLRKTTNLNRVLLTQEKEQEITSLPTS